ncbi:unnamed protein product [Miscanthus lutarioriparius]|uniref:Metallo-beta-lactamase domain-containing protein n=1 Tax=Miscanthus lutarioriparius TaxID=422564 RepID=A0A811PVP4_9POAL|nr:unnamed protein product [Miscanthus lutarioriparius]
MAKSGESTVEVASSSSSPLTPASASATRLKAKHRMEIEGYPVDGVSIGGQETCVIFPTLSLAFDIGRCPQRAVSQEFLFVSHGHLDHIGGLPMYVATRGLFRLRPPTIFVPACLRDLVERLFEVHRAIDQSELNHNLVPLEGYVIYSVKQKLKQEFVGLPGSEIKQLKLSGVEITNTVSTPEIAFTGDTTADFILDPDNADVLQAKILVVESTFLDDSISVQHAREYGHTHLSEIASQSDNLGNKAILLIHFSARYTTEEIDVAINRLPPSFRSRVYALKEGF